MKIILNKKLNNYNKGDVINVKNGYAKNYLIPFEKAIIATKKEIKKLDINKNNLQENIYFNDFNQLKDLSLVIGVIAKNDNELYGSINNKVIVKIFKKINIKINENNIGKNMFIKKVGIYKINIKNKKNNIKSNFYLILSKVN